MLNAYALNTRAINARGAAPVLAKKAVAQLSMSGQLRPALSAAPSTDMRIGGEIVSYPVACLPISGKASMSGQLRPALSAALDSSMTMAVDVRWRARSDLLPTAIAYVLATGRTAYVKEVV